MRKAAKSSEQLIAKLNKELDLEIPSGTEAHSLKTGRNQKRSGAWSWMLYNKEYSWVSNIGSCDTITQVIRAKKLTKLNSENGIGHIEIIAENG